jgi:hypothetical protein
MEAEKQRTELLAAPFALGPADHHEFLPVEAFRLHPDAAIARRIGLVDPL